MALSIEEMLADLEAADAAGDTELANAIAAQIKTLQAGSAAPAPAGPAPGPAPAAPPALPAAPGGPVGGPPATPAATPPPTPGGGPAAPAAFDPQAEFERIQAENVAGMSGMERFLAGAGQSVDSNIRGARQIYNYLTGDEATLQKLKDEENESRRMDAALLGTGAGRSGQVTGHIAQALLPGGAAGKASTALGGGLVRTAALEGVAGAGMGALQPTTGDESRGVNMAVGGTIGAALPFASRIATLPMTAKANLLRVFTPRGGGGITDVVARLGGKAEKISKAGGKKIQDIVEQVRVPATKELAAKLRGVQRDYGRALPPIARQRLAQMIEAAENPSISHIKGTAAQTARSDFGKEAAASEGFRQSGLNRAKRVIDEAMENQMSKAQIRALRQAREQYRTGIKPLSETSHRRASTRGLAHAIRAGALPVYDDEETQN